MLCVCCDGCLDPMGPRLGMPKKTGGKHAAGWWFGTWFLYTFMTFHMLGRIIPTDEVIFFRGVGQPPTRQSMRELLGVPLLPITNVAVQLQSVSVGLDHFPWLFHCGKKTQPGNWSYVLKHIEKDGYFFGCFVSPFLAKIGFLFPCFFAFLFPGFLLFCFLLFLASAFMLLCLTHRGKASAVTCVMVLVVH